MAPTDDTITSILTTTKRIAIVGLSDRATRPSYGVAAFLIGRGYDVVGVNPALAGQTVLGRPVFATLAEAAPLDMVDIFRASDQAGAVVREAMALGARTVWLQLGVIDDAAANEASAAGLRVVMDRCPLIEWQRLGLPRATLGRALRCGRARP